MRAAGFGERKERRSGGILGEGGTSLHTDGLFNPDKCHERASHCYYACDDSLVGSLASARGCELATLISFEWDANDERNGAERTVWETLLVQEKEIKERQHWFFDFAKPVERSTLSVVWALATHLNFTKEDLACAMRYFTSCEYRLKDVWRSRSRPPQPFSQGQSGVACSCTLCCRTL